MTREKMPACKLSGTDGNVFALAGRVREALRKAGQGDKASQFSKELFECHSYSEALALMANYVRIR